MIEAKLKNSPDWKRYENCCIGISMDSRNHKGEALQAVVSWARGKFKQCIFDVSDTLHAETCLLDYNIPYEEALLKSYQKGNEWLDENINILATIGMPYEIRRWDTVRLHPDFEDIKRQFFLLMEKNLLFKMTVSNDVRAFLERKFHFSRITNQHIQLCINYLLNELAGHTILFRDYECATVYPGRQAKCFELVRNGMIPEAPFGLQNSYFTRLSLYGFEDDLHKDEEKHYYFKKAANA